MVNTSDPRIKNSNLHKCVLPEVKTPTGKLNRKYHGAFEIGIKLGRVESWKDLIKHYGLSNEVYTRIRDITYALKPY